MQTVNDEPKLEQISELLSRIDDDHDGQLKVDDVLKVIDTLLQYSPIIIMIIMRIKSTRHYNHFTIHDYSTISIADHRNDWKRKC